MKHLRLSFLFFASALGLARAQDAQEEERRAPPTEIPDFSNLDEYIYEPKSTVTYGVRRLSGAKATFSGQGKILSPDLPGEATGANVHRAYHDGAVSPDARSIARVDETGVPVTDPTTGSQIFDLVAPDGKTNTWNYTSDGQLTSSGQMSFHTYSADIVDTAARQKESASTYGMEVAVYRDMGKLFGTKMSWNLFAGMSVNDISANTADKVRANLTTITDYYSLFGQTPPVAPYSAPSSSTQNVLDASGNPAVNEDGTTGTVTVDTSVLLGNEPLNRTTTIAADTTSITNRWKVKGAYFTFRAGPTIWVPITSRLRVSVSVGPALVYAGSDYTVTETFVPESGSETANTNSSAVAKLLPGYYADATLQFDLTERAGFYAGAVFQSAGTYVQNLDSDTSHYQTKIDLSNQNGVRAGMSIRF